jgi:N-acetylmuramoyl-L-alanine amidase
MSSKQDLKNLSSPDWQSDFAKAVVEGILQWYIEDQKRAQLRRQ